MSQLSPDGRYYWDGSVWRPVVDATDRPRRWPWFLATAVGLGVLLAVCTAAAGVSSSAGRPAAQTARSPNPAPCAAPCASANGSIVTVSSLRYAVASGSAFQRPEAGNVFVTVEVSFANHSAAEQHVDPFQFVLQDGAGVKHAITWIDACPAWAGVNLTAGATFGPRCLAFQAAADRPTGLVLVWTPGLFAGDHLIKLT